MRQTGLMLALLATLGLALAGCNFPGVTRPEGELSASELRQTLAAGDWTPAATSPAMLQTEAAPTGIASPAPTFVAAQGTAGPSLPTPGVMDDGGTWRYTAQPGDILPAVALRFGVDPGSIRSPQSLPEQAFIPAGLELTIPKTALDAPYPQGVLPDSEVVNSPAAAGFDVTAFIQQAGGYLNEYREWSGGQWLSGAQVVERVARESSVNPRLLLALIELRSGWVRGRPAGAEREKYPLGFHVANWEGLYKELVIAATHLNGGYYGWRNGTALELSFQDGGRVRIYPGLNAGSAAVQSLLAKLTRRAAWEPALYGAGGLLDVYRQMFGDPWQSRNLPLFPDGLAQPELALPFAPGQRWSLTGGPHAAWKTGSPRGALDFAPVTGEMRCSVSAVWATAPAAGVVARSDRGVVALDLDGDGLEQTGWVLIFLHLADAGRIPVGTRVAVDDPLGHPSCEYGASTGTHMHVARKYNGEWISADGPLPFVLGGWQAYAGAQEYQGGMLSQQLQVVASPVGPRTSIIIR